MVVIIILKKQLILFNFLLIICSSLTLLFPITSPSINKEIQTSKEYNEYLILVNKEKPLDKDYIPDNLITIVNVDYIIRENETMRICETVYYYYSLLYNESLKLNLNLTIFSAYRSYNKQSLLFKRNPDEYYVARAGYSEHQTGLALDVSTRNTGLTKNFMYTKEYKFLLDNAHKYGFIIRYPENKMHITGYLFEPWHLRFVGIEHAKVIYENKLTLEEYLS